jgi:hypothetical protein
MEYLVFRDAQQAKDTLEFLNRWNQRPTGSNWAGLVEHPSRHLYAVPVDDRVRPALDLSKVNATLMSEANASMEGFYFGPLSGRFYKPLHQCGDAELLIDEFVKGFGRLPFPLARSLFFASLGVLYAARCHLGEILTGEVAKGLPRYDSLSSWWQARCQEMHRHGELLHFLHGLNNSEKHSRPSVAVALLPEARYLMPHGEVIARGSEFMGEPRGLRLSAGGLFQAAPFAPGYERWRSPDPTQAHPDYGITGANFTFTIAGLPDRHLGQRLVDSKPPAVLRLYLDYHYDVLRAAIEQWNAASSQPNPSAT